MSRIATTLCLRLAQCERNDSIIAFHTVLKTKYWLRISEKLNLWSERVVEKLIKHNKVFILHVAELNFFYKFRKVKKNLQEESFLKVAIPLDGY